jgi:PIN domain-containing protein
MAIPNLLFVDANIWLDFYRVRNDTGLRLLEHVEALSEKLIVTYQLENEYKRNRQAPLNEGMQELKAPQQIPRPGIFSDAAAARMMVKNVKEAEKRVKKLRERVVKALRDPSAHDPVYQSCQRLFQKTDDLTLRRDNPMRRIIRRRAFRRFLHGCLPRKRNDTSIGDAFNWEWMVHCAKERTAGLVIVTRDSDYGLTIDSESYINDALRQEFSERVSRKRKLRLYSRLSDALKLFDVAVTAQEEESESELVSRNPFLANEGLALANYSRAYDAIFGNSSVLAGNFDNLPSLRNFGKPSVTPIPLPACARKQSWSVCTRLR